MERYDIAIIGTGPAGLSAAITAKIRNKKILLIGNPNFSDKVQKSTPNTELFRLTSYFRKRFGKKHLKTTLTLWILLLQMEK